MADLKDKERAVRAHEARISARLARHFKAWLVVVVGGIIVYAVYVGSGMRAAAVEYGRATALVHSTVAIYRDQRGIPHIRAADEHDAFFAEGFVEGSDRLFQMDLIRRYIYGDLAEMLGPIQLADDEAMRALDVHDIVDREWQYLPNRDRAALQAYSDGVNAAMRAQPLPVEFRLLLYRPSPWTPRDCLAVTLAISASMGDTADIVARRDYLWRSLSHAEFGQVLPLSDPAYDVALNGNRQPHSMPAQQRPWIRTEGIRLPSAGSNAWAAGAAKTVDGHALIANDPHLDPSIPGVWYVLEVRAPGIHVAGVTIPGIPGVVLGHNQRIAWAATNAMAATLSVFQPGALPAHNWKREIFHVRLAPDVSKEYFRTDRDFGAQTRDGLLLVRWDPYSDARSALSTVLALNRAQSIREALADLAQYAGPPENFELADSNGDVAYHVAGPIADDPVWGRYLHPASDIPHTFAPIPFDKLPSLTESPDAIVLSANNKMYSEGYRYRLSAMFAPPYRAYRIAGLLHARAHYDLAYFERMQLDAISPADAEFAHRVAEYAKSHRGFAPPSVTYALSQWNGAFTVNSRAATIEHTLREAVERDGISPYAPFDALRATSPSPQVLQDLTYAANDDVNAQRWGSAGEVSVSHPFGPIGFPFLDGATLPGDGDEYTVRVQTNDLTQSFRAVWDVGDWERGGVSIPSGESGEIGSPHYDDLATAWVRGRMEPLPFSDDAVRRSTRETLLLSNF